jgi:tetratricopeptide (TPR) repeat protein
VHLQRARELDPAAVAPSEIDLGRVHAWLGDFDAAVAAWKRDLELVPTHFSSLHNLGSHYCRIGDLAGGLRLLERARAVYPDSPEILSDIAYCHAANGAEDEARSRLAELEAWTRREYVDPVNMAIVYAGLGQRDEAFRWLESAYALRAFKLVKIGRNLRFEPLRSDPRFQDLLRRIGLSG